MTKNLIQKLVESKLFDIDIFCKKSDISSLDGVNSIKILSKKSFVEELEAQLAQKKYDYVLASDILLPFGNLLIHSNSAKYKTKNAKSKFCIRILKLYNSQKIKKQEKIFKLNDKHIFTVSESLKNDYVQNYNLDEKNVFACYPAVDNIGEFSPTIQKSEFIIGGLAGGGLNKGGFLLLHALKKLKKDLPGKFKARIIFPKINKAFLYKLLIKLFKLQDIIELLPKQSDMKSFYESIDCYVLPSLNEAFGLVVTEAASNSRPSLVSSTTGVRELIIDGENGFVFNRAKQPVKNLYEGLKRVYNLYSSDYKKYVEISKNAYELSKSLDWQEFADIIIKNLKEEK